MNKARASLVLDDNADIADIVCAAAEMVQVQCTVTSSVAELMQELGPETDVIFMDLKMPGISGTQVLALLAQRHCQAGIVLMSGVGSVALAEAESYGRSIGLMMRSSLAKPFRIPELQAILRGEV